jgi:LPXTG-motif cell wall-anchored protein
MPAGYAFADRFGLGSETLRVFPARLAETGATAATLPLAAGLMLIGILLGNIRRRSAFRSV